MDIVLFGQREGHNKTKAMLDAINTIENLLISESITEVREFVYNNKVDMIFIDADDNKIDWKYLSQEFVKINQSAKVVLMSSESEQSVRAYEAGVFDYLLKPVKIKQLERVITKYWAEKRVTR